MPLARLPLAQLRAHDTREPGPTRAEAGRRIPQPSGGLPRLTRVNPDDMMLSGQRTRIGALMLTVLGVLLLAHNAMPIELHQGPLHAALVLGSIAAAFGTIYAFGYGGRRWARLPAIFFASVAGVVLLAAWPWHWLFGWGFGLPLWPVLLIVLGLWVVRRDHRWA